MRWELTTGRRLYGGGTGDAVTKKIRSTAVPPPSSLVADYPDRLKATVMRALAADRERRHEIALAFQEDLACAVADLRPTRSSGALADLMSGLFPVVLMDDGQTRRECR